MIDHDQPTNDREISGDVVAAPASPGPSDSDTEDGIDRGPQQDGTTKESDRNQPGFRFFAGAAFVAILTGIAPALLDSDSVLLSTVFLITFVLVTAVVAHRATFPKALATMAAAGLVWGLLDPIIRWTITDGKPLADLLVPDVVGEMFEAMFAALTIGMIPAAIGVMVRRKKRARPKQPEDPKRELEQAQRDIRRGVITALVVAVVGAVAITIAMVSNPREGMLAYLDDPWNFVEVVIPLVLAYGMHRRSRTATTMALVWYLWSRIYWSIETGRFAGGIVALLVIYLLARATRGSFAYHRIKRATGTPYPTPAPWKVVLATLGTTLVVTLVVYAALAKGGLIPNTAALPGDELKGRQVAALVAKGIIQPDEEIVYFYSDGLFSILEDGNLFTKDRVVSYQDNGNSFWCDSSRFDEIIDLHVTLGSGLFKHTEITVSTEDGRMFSLIVSTENKRDQTFVEMLEERWRYVRVSGDTLLEPRVWYDGGTGETEEDAVVVLGARYDPAGTMAELEWLTRWYGYQGQDWRLVTYSHHRVEEREIDRVTIELPDGKEREVFFDITESYGTPPPDSLFIPWIPWRDDVRRPTERIGAPVVSGA